MRTFAGPQPNPSWVARSARCLTAQDSSVCCGFRKQSGTRVSRSSRPATFSTATRLLGQSDFNTTRSTGSTAAKLASAAIRDRAASTARCRSCWEAARRSMRPPRRRTSTLPIRSTIGCSAYRDYRKVNADVTADLVIGQPDFVDGAGELSQQQPDASERAGAVVAGGDGGGRQGQPVRRRYLQCARGPISGAIRANDGCDCRRPIWFWGRPAWLDSPSRT